VKGPGFVASHPLGERIHLAINTAPFKNLARPSEKVRQQIKRFHLMPPAGRPWPVVRSAKQTGWGQSRDKTLAGEAGFDHHLTKPVAFEDLEKLLAEIALLQVPTT
jgi:hypothetical protein